MFAATCWKNWGGLEVPKTLDEFTALLKAAKAKYGVYPYTSSKVAFSNIILTAFNLTDVSYVDGVFTPRIKNKNLPDYLAYMQQLYSEKLLDTDFVINTADNAKEKFASKNALACDNIYFWDIPALKTAVDTSNPNCKVQFITPLAKDAATNPVIVATKGIGAYFCISKNAKTRNMQLTI